MHQQRSHNITFQGLGSDGAKVPLLSFDETGTCLVTNIAGWHGNFPSIEFNDRTEKKKQ